MNNQPKSLDKFLTVSSENQKDVLKAMALKLKKSPQILEKDVWVCLALQKLFTMPNALTMVFKGGTSLSKAFKVIDRFSEDVDVTIDFRNFTNEDPFSPNVSNTRRKKISDNLKISLRDYLKETVLPYLQDEIQNECDSNASIKLTNDGEGIEIHFKSVFESPSSYIKPFVFLEFGARNFTEPNDVHEIAPYIAGEVPALVFPKANVCVLAPERTFWEKITMMHVECNRGKFKEKASRLSRHWYDVVMLYLSDIGKSALSAQNLLISVVEHKKVFFNTPYAKYDLCLEGQFNLIPTGDQFEQLKTDYQNMTNSDMFYGNFLAFEEIIKHVKSLSEMLNK